MTALVTGGTKGIGVREWKNKGFKVTVSVCDLTSKSEREELIKEVSSVFDGKLNILSHSGVLQIIVFEDLSSMMSTNVESPYHLCQLAYPLLKASGNGSIVFVASIAGVISLPRLSAYAATKTGGLQCLPFIVCGSSFNQCTQYKLLSLQA
ncbi:putative tropinone reductase II [Rosa chinensis]|uniref:Putative tropinone reductase II n=1 Tax=Rosa chinensis TaxID=74649 RepID=A0A2P6R9S3_ROSCH|nr:putative tropinone reductase II [Rosa chinensis]